MLRFTLSIMMLVGCLSGCGQSTQVPPGPEGSKDFECSDGLDNDEDGDVDCDDSGCADSPSCQDVSDSTDPSDSSDASDASAMPVIPATLRIAQIQHMSDLGNE